MVQREDLRNKANMVRRLASEKEHRVREAEMAKNKLTELKRKGAIDRDLSCQEEKAKDLLMEASNCRMRLTEAATELKRLIDIEPGLSHTPEYENAKQILRSACNYY